MNRTRIVFLIGLLVTVPVASVAAQGLVKRSGRHIELTTDLAMPSEAETLVASFDAAAVQWFKFWNIDDDRAATWRVEAFVIRDKSLFRRNGLIPNHIPNFPFGYASGNSIWVLAQQSDYYTRHLLLHEGVHALAFSYFGGAGPTWFMEGTAELLSTHSGQDAATKVNQIPADRSNVPYWGRFKLMDQLRDRSSVPTIETVMRYQASLTGNVEMYGWSWAAAMMLHHYPEYQDAFFAAASNGRDAGPEFNRRLYQQITPQKWPVLAARWRLMCRDLDYGFDWSRESVSISENDPIWDGTPMRIDVAANRGWQSLGVRIAPGRKLTLDPDGEIVLDTDPKPWTSRPAGITIQYHRGRPLGQLLACIVPNAADRGEKLTPLKITPISSSTSLTIERHSWVLLRINDAVGATANNTGSFEVAVR